jgi:hypothetical protein
MFHRLLDQIGELKGTGRLPAVNGGRFSTANTLQKVLQFRIKRLDRGGADLLNEAVVPIQKLTVIGGIPLVGPAVDVKGVIQEIGFNQA